jgi:hypothetical protein
MAYAERQERKKGVRYRGIYKAADGATGRPAPSVRRSGRSRSPRRRNGTPRSLSTVRRAGWTRLPARRGRLRSTRRCFSDTARSRWPRPSSS